MTLWGPLAERYETERPRKLLALDGGGIRGVLTLEILAEIERQLAKLTGRGAEFRLCDFFDYIGGTSTGAIIAAGLARGMSTSELLEFYKDMGPRMFQKASWLRRLRGLYQSKPIVEALKDRFGPDTDLFPKHLKCLLMAVTRNVTTDSPWPISSNPLAQFNDPKLSDCNLKIPLWQLVRASTAAPVFFTPERIALDGDNPSKIFVFEDGGITPYNNPAFLLFRMATLPAYRLEWPTGERNLMLVSVGTGAAPTTDDDVFSKGKNLVANIGGLPGALMYGSLVDQDINCRTIGRCVHGDPIDYELGDLVPRDASGNRTPLDQDLGRDFLYGRYNATLTAKGLMALGLDGLEPAKVQRLDAVDFIEDLSRVGRAVAATVDMGAFGSLVTA